MKKKFFVEDQADLEKSKLILKKLSNKGLGNLYGGYTNYDRYNEGTYLNNIHTNKPKPIQK